MAKQPPHDKPALQDWRVRIPLFDAVVSLGTQLGIFNVVASAAAFLVGVAVVALAWLYENLPAWGLALLFIWTVAGFLFSTWAGLGVWVRWKEIRRLSVIDARILADEAARISNEIFALLGEYRAPLRKAWENEVRSNSRAEMSEIEGKLLEKYAREYEGDAWRIINAAKTVHSYDRYEFWPMSHGAASSQHDVERMAIALSQVASDLRYGRRMEPKENAK